MNRVTIVFESMTNIQKYYIYRVTLNEDWVDIILFLHKSCTKLLKALYYMPNVEKHDLGITFLLIK